MVRVIAITLNTRE